MKIALLSDVHANLAALEAVLAAAHAAGAEAVWNMGDSVGYGAEPDAVVSRLREAGAASVMGNHDAAAIGVLGLEAFNPFAAEAAGWTARTVAPETVAFLAALPQVEGDGKVTRCHGTLADPLWRYFDSVEAAEGHFALLETPCSVVGHTHVPLFVRKGAGGLEASGVGNGESFELGEEQVCLNPGSVGQPRDGDPRASWALLDTGRRRVTYHRVPYDIATTQRRIRAAGLPAVLADRLALGR
ncbi:MAG: metallophosphoesterase family protein [Dehalococcoidia bacterium]|nr:metallophosphoesterase family protein [Dehalococcoidia bacterium]